MTETTKPAGCPAEIPDHRPARDVIDRCKETALTELNALATEVIRAASHGDQHFVKCLNHSDPTTTRLRLAIVTLADWLREH